MSIHPSFLGHVEIPDLFEPRPPLGRPDGVRVVRLPRSVRGEVRRP